MRRMMKDRPAAAAADAGGGYDWSCSSDADCTEIRMSSTAVEAATVVDHADC